MMMVRYFYSFCSGVPAAVGPVGWAWRWPRPTTPATAEFFLVFLEDDLEDRSSPATCLTMVSDFYIYVRNLFFICNVFNFLLMKKVILLGVRFFFQLTQPIQG